MRTVTFGELTRTAFGGVPGVQAALESGATFTFIDPGTGTLPTGTVFTVINNTSASPIAGRFSNLANGFSPATALTSKLTTPAAPGTILPSR